MNETPKRGSGKPAQRPGAQTQRGRKPVSRGGERVPAQRAGKKSTVRRAGQRQGGQQRVAGNPPNRRPTQSRPSKRPARRDLERSRFRRRLLALGVAGLLAVAAVIFVIKYALTKIETHSTPVNPVAQFEPVACTPSELTASAEVAGRTAGKPIKVATSIKNRGEKPCYFDASELRLQLTSGDHTVYDSQVCKTGPANKLLLLDTGMTTTQELPWNGINVGPNCTGTSPAGAGTYVARVFIGTEPILESGAIFELRQATAPKPANTGEPEGTKAP
ncbi:hypothetical protein QEU98_00875 [Trueperella pyogenes]|uniref:hypothetical protein n=1 Tax=Trueperella pyogenes TaxID=1661 RepID=UPI0032479123